jgi:myosin-5
MKAVASRVSDKSDVLLLAQVDMDDSGPYEIAEPRVITALETYTPSCKLLYPYLAACTNTSKGLQTPKLKRLAEIVSEQALQHEQALDEEDDLEGMNGNGIGHEGGHGLAIENLDA